VSCCWSVSYSVWYGVIEPAAAFAVRELGSGAVPVASSEAPTEERPPFGSELVVSELDVPDDAGDEPMEDMPLILRTISPRYAELAEKQAP
jgi:hypothetical protein